MIMYHPSVQFYTDTAKIVQQIDIQPTIADFLGIGPDKLPRFGQSVLKKDSDRNALFYAHNSYYLVKKEYYLEMSDDNFRFKDWKDNMTQMNLFGNKGRQQRGISYENIQHAQTICGGIIAFFGRTRKLFFGGKTAG